LLGGLLSIHEVNSGDEAVETLGKVRDLSGVTRSGSILPFATLLTMLFDLSVDQVTETWKIDVVLSV
jgi:hypothetical protein